MKNETPNYWIEYTDSTKRMFYAESDADARHYFMMEGDHAYDYGPIEKLHVDVMDWITVINNPELISEGGQQEMHRTRSGKGAVGQAIARHKKPPNCS